MTFNPRTVYDGSDGQLTKDYYAHLSKLGKMGELAIQLFRAQKASLRAKKYRGGIPGKGSFRSMAYEKKGWAIEQLCAMLDANPDLGITFGWKKDPKAMNAASWVVYIDLPEGQVSFHSMTRNKGPDYAGDWDQEHNSEERILQFCFRVGQAVAV